ncbi:unnamed protein product [Meloidogyne enterolobii]|uniref:Uncharacterized protein n=1 Tax=Meloidogyne enterolobii TaxID=390850 RepID=A0ACB0XUG9_MELEN
MSPTKFLYLFTIICFILILKFNIASTGCCCSGGALKCADPPFGDCGTPCCSCSPPLCSDPGAPGPC